MSNDDNIIDATDAFRRNAARPEPSEADAGVLASGSDLESLVETLMQRMGEPGVDPSQLVAGLLGSFGGAPGGAGPSFDRIELAQPELLDRREEPVTYRVRVDLDGVEPPIWRRLDLPSDLMLDRLHIVLQVAMGWTDSHLHAFSMGAGPEGENTAAFLNPYAVAEGEIGIPESVVRLDEVLAEPGDGLVYDYDFGDGWEHTILLEEVRPAGDAGCVGGARACPPEDCGGVPGYEDILALLAGGSPERSSFQNVDDLRSWLPPGWRPDEFDVQAVDEGVRAIVAGGAAGLPPLDELDPTLAGLLTRLQGTSGETLLTVLAAAALADAPGGMFGLDEEGGADEASIVAVTTPVQVFLDVVGDGAELTSAGYLKPAAVSQIYSRLRMDRFWIGAGNREDYTPPVAELRHTMQSLGLIRRRGSRLLPTKAAQRLRGDAAGLWEWIASRLPAGTTQEKDAGVLLLVAFACGEFPPDFIGACGAILAESGWRGGRFTEVELDDALFPTLQVLQSLGALEAWTRGAITDAGMDLATRALLRP